MSACSQCGYYNCDIPFPHSEAVSDFMEKEIKVLKRDLDNFRSQNQYYAEKCFFLEGEIARLRDALKIIADSGDYGWGEFAAKALASPPKEEKLT